MIRYKALHQSSGWLGKTFWEPGDISAPTDLKPPVSKVVGPLFEPLTESETQVIEKALEGAVEKETMYTMTQKSTPKKSKVGMNHKT